MRRTILYVGQLWEGGTCGERMKILLALGNRIIPFDTTPYIDDGSRFTRFLAHRANIGRPVSALNRDLLRFARDQDAGISHVWIDKGKWIRADTVSAIKSMTGAPIIHYTPDPQLVYHRSHLFNACIPLYDCLVTTKSYEIDRYRALDAKHVLQTIQGFDSRFFPRQPTPEQLARFGADLVFVGHCEPHYARALNAVRKTGVKLRVWGPGWVRYARWHAWARPHVGGDGIWGVDYPIALSCAKIGLGLLSKLIPETSTTRSFEIPASGILLLAERTDEHQELFQDRVEAEYFASNEELVEKMLGCLRNDAERCRVALAGKKRCDRSGYASKEVLVRLLKQIDEQIPGSN